MASESSTLSENSATESGQPIASQLRGIRDRMLEGLLVMLPIVITLWIVKWLYLSLSYYIIEPLAHAVLWKGRTIKGTDQLPEWFEFYAAPILGVLMALAILYVSGVFAHTRLRKNLDALMLRVPVISHIYEAVKSVFQVLEKSPEQTSPQRIVLVQFPHPGMRVPAIVTSSCKDIKTGRVLLCVYIPTTPVPTSGYFLMVPEDEVCELNWDVQETLQTIISGGLTAPPLVSFFGTSAPPENNPLPFGLPIRQNVPNNDDPIARESVKP